ncbi:DNA helicase [Achromobacter phage JWX]|uniref:Uncharacterized protein n=1 Tax=Achromobacter phage JWX TaxID=1589746 RepID=A0A0B5A1P5_9CAUD|nr:DNA helicase [Achromobacter phage JWX]AJD82803.1 hypothetical protein JWX_00037 [Achromobacter phage JWX]WLW38456.1 DNA helicase [Achromobacter phage JWT]
MAASPKIAETALWKWVREGKVHFGRDLHIQRIESTTGLGIPDVEACLKMWPSSISFWLELKAVARPARESTPIRHNITAEQIAWHRNRYHAGGHSYVLLQIGSGHESKKYLIPGSELLAFQKPITEEEIRACAREATDWTPQRLLDACARPKT